MRYRGVFTISVCLLTTGLAGQAFTADWGKYEVDGRRSGYTYAQPETRAMEDDNIANPSFAWVDQGEAMWSKKEGKAGKSCASCHGDASKSMKKVAGTYPVYAKELGKLINVEQRINQCRVERMQANAWKWESKELLSMTAYVKYQGRGTTVNPVIDGPAKPFFDKGKAFYEQRAGQLDLACMHCHQLYAGKHLRANLLSQGQSNGFPTYRLKWQKLGSLHRRFRGCNKQVRAQPLKYGADEYVNLELYLAWRGRGLPIESPSVRN